MTRAHHESEGLDLFQGKKVFYVTNNSSNTRAKMVEKCHKLGFPAEKVGILESIICFPQYVFYDFINLTQCIISRLMHKIFLRSVDYRYLP